jgi:hypothetical protein
MGVRVVLAEGESIGQALRRLRKLLERHRALRWRTPSFIKQTEIRRAKRFKKKFKARLATLLAIRAGEQPDSSGADLTTFWKKTGKP